MDAQEFTDVIQVCTDGSSLSEKGVMTAVELAKTLGLPLLGMTVVKGMLPKTVWKANLRRCATACRPSLKKRRPPVFPI